MSKRILTEKIPHFFFIIFPPKQMFFPLVSILNFPSTKVL
jgi:hypothetical protein